MRCLKIYVILFGIILGLFFFFEGKGRAEVGSADSLDNLSLSMEKSLVSADIRGIPLHTVMSRLASLTGVNIYVNPLVGEKKVAVAFDDQELESAIRRLLKGTNYALLYNRKIDKADRNLDKYSISIFIVDSNSNSAFAESMSKSEEEDMAYFKKPAEPLENLQDANNEVKTPLKEIDHNVLNIHEPNDKIAELQAQVSEHGANSLPLILASLLDPDLEVQAASVNLLLNDLREVVPTDTLSQLGLRSENPKIRIDALRLLTNRQDESGITQGTLELAMMDSDPNVQKEAHQMLDHLKANGTTAKNDTSNDLLSHPNGKGEAIINE